ncbi:hypothetical protein KO481_35155 [Nocardia sp. NEAU-G5]|uniref:SnoaL-like domain-containing protein n=2 Tax=Nocardiaceae TaxID=85025 RepID=A0ABS6B9D0_9NOCA|nr:hypothetical protein [Nocardia albiluteola]
MNDELTDNTVKELADRYVAMWNEPDPDRRRALVREVWSVDAHQVVVNPPEPIRDAARNHGIVPPALEVHGYDAMDERVTRAFEMFVEPGEYVFELDGAAAAQAGGAVTLTWVMRTRADGAVAGSGFDVFTLDADHRIRTDHQFVA